MDPDGTYEHDVYDELLTQAEIQGNITKVNSKHMVLIFTLIYKRSNVLPVKRKAHKVLLYLWVG